MTTYTPPQITQIITQEATALGVDPQLALAVAEQESGMNPDSIGDGGHSVGLFQLNDQGEGAGMSTAARQDPVANARIAITQIANVMKSQPGLSPGQIAAAAQRPADQVGYAKAIDAAMGNTLSPEQQADQSASGSTYRAQSAQGQATTGDGAVLSEADLEGSYGYAAAFFNSDPELTQLITKATAQQWTPDEFKAQFQATQWYQSHSQAYRDYDVLKTSDPADFANQLKQKTADVMAQAVQMGSSLDSATAQSIADQDMQFGWDATQLGQALATHVSLNSNGGNAADTQQTMQTYLSNMGVKYSPTTMQSDLQRIEGGQDTLQGWQNNIRTIAESAFPAYAAPLQAGKTVADIASPYLSSMASILELNPDSLSVNDPTIRQALTATDKTGQPVQTGLWQFEKSLMADPRWQYTKNAADTTYSTIHQIGNDFGFTS